MNVLIIDPDDARAALVAEGIRADSAHQDATIHHWPRFELARLKDINPEMVIIACESPDRDTLDALQIAHEQAPRPVAMFVDRSDANTTAEALEAGVAAYIVDGYSPNRVASILTVATHRFNLMQTLRADLSKAKADLAARKSIDRAKGVLMTSRGISEDDAYKILRKHAMDTGRPMAAVAADILAISGLLKPGEG
ncbi:ANTAR domain-containing protein [Asticcacaulis sp. ZE23SCel15]|uniref:ANTAR domain-containing response regulator n=1 Tax=Asticcacaulis sp. ZE23SCel15 TaxID=3059027 RepID=UPI0026603CE6|nr:ANTAR domain-containing protein [Asticcacaulis sp. ZE23SCel15]WKL58690.1 ANTAR domain-containing protein [Asticcacaulis sp. ZE23SCel15]